VGFYRWHLPDPVVFASTLRVTLQQIGYALFGAGQEWELGRFAESNPWAGAGPQRRRPGVLAEGIAERADDVCATAFVYCREPQGVPRLDLSSALADIERRPHETPNPLEGAFAPPPDSQS
jgi:hypothetical protein